MGFSNSSEVALLQKQSEIFSRLLPDAVVLATLAIVGALGNIMAAMFYTKRFKRTTTLNLIIALILNDFVVCILFIPNFVEMKLNINNNHSLLCKITHFLNQLFIGTSCILLGVISIDRYRRICKPFGKQIPTTALKYVIPFVFFLSLCTALRKLWDYDTVQVYMQMSNNDTSNNVNITGHFCTNTKDPDLQVLVTSFYAFDLLSVLTIWVVVIIAYSKAIHTVTKQRRKDKRLSEKIHFRSATRGHDVTGSGNGIDTFQSIVIERPAHHIYGMDISDNQISCTSDGNDGENINISTDTISHMGCTNDLSEYTKRPHTLCNSKWNTNTTSKRKTNDGKKTLKRSILKNVSRLEQNLTYMMFTASVMFLLCFIPFFTVKLMRSYLDDIVKYELQTGLQFTLKLPLVNSVFTPIIYCIFNSKFRRFLKPKLCKF